MECKEDWKLFLAAERRAVVLSLVDLCSPFSDGLSLSPSLPPGGVVSARPQRWDCGSVLCFMDRPYSDCHGEKYAIRLSLRVTSGWKNGGNCSETSGRTQFMIHKRNTADTSQLDEVYSRRLQHGDRMQ